MGWAGAFQFYLVSFVQPFGTLWFIYMLPVIFVVTKLAARQRACPGSWCLAPQLSCRSRRSTGWLPGRRIRLALRVISMPATFSRRKSSELAAWARDHLAPSLRRPARLGCHQRLAGLSRLVRIPVVSLALGAAGALAVILTSALIVKAGQHGFPAPLRRELHRHLSGVLLPDGGTRVILLKTRGILDIGTISAIVTVAGVIAPVILLWVIQTGHWLVPVPPAGMGLS
jgi:hypothetical protein